jgi:O-antigen ligase
MAFTSFLWLLIWGGMFTGIYNLQSPSLMSSPISFIQGARALLPLAALYLAVIRIMVKRSRYPFIGAPLGYLVFYAFIGTVSSIFLSPVKTTALYWAGMYIAPLLVMWIVMDMRESTVLLRKILHLNNAVVILVTLALFPEVFRVGGIDERFVQFYNLPFGMGQMRVNGAGRFALVTIIVAFTFLISRRGLKKIPWLALIPIALFILAQTRSRTSLLGFAVAGMLLVFILGIDWRFIFVAPVVTYIIYLSGIKWRLHGHVERLMFLTGRDYTWRKGLAQIKESPFLGWGFHADRLLLNSEHMHNSYLHSAIHSGIFGSLMFAAAILGIWLLLVKSGLLGRIRNISGPDLPLLMQSVMIVGFLTARSFFESTAAFYGVDLLLLVPAMAFLFVWVHENRPGTESTLTAAPGDSSVRSQDAVS